MAVYLVQHGEALPEAQDPERSLSETGHSETRRIAEVAASYRVQVARIEHSGKKRAQQTAQILADALHPAGGVGERQGLSPKDDVRPVATSLDASSNVMLVGHLPFMERLVGQVVVGDPDRRLFKFQGGGIVCLDRDEAGWYIRWTLSPRIG
jgi:phosphohistidine phosphatase